MLSARLADLGAELAEDLRVLDGDDAAAADDHALRQEGERVHRVGVEDAPVVYIYIYIYT